MISLDRDVVLDLYAIDETKGLSKNGKIWLAVHANNSVVVTNREIILSWPQELVDFGCKEVTTLLKLGKSKPVGKELLTTPWTKTLFMDYSSVLDCMEDEILETSSGLLHVYKAGNGRYAFDPTYHQLVEKVWPPHIIDHDVVMSVSYRIQPMKDRGNGIGSLIVTECGKMVGALACVQPNEDGSY